MKPYFKGQTKSDCCYYPDVMRICDFKNDNNFYRLTYCRKHKQYKTEMLSSYEFSKQDLKMQIKKEGASIKRFNDIANKEIKRLKN